MATNSQLNLPPSLVRSSDGPKEVIRKSDKSEFYAQLGGCMRDVMHTFGLNLDEFAGELDKDPRQIKRQMDGVDRPQIEAVFAVERFRPAMVIALARMSAGVEVDTVLHIRSVKRSA